MKANLSIHFSELFSDTYHKHGISYCWEYYHVVNKMPMWELRHWISVSEMNKGKI